MPSVSCPATEQDAGRFESSRSFSPFCLVRATHPHSCPCFQPVGLDSTVARTLAEHDADRRPPPDELAQDRVPFARFSRGQLSEARRHILAVFTQFSAEPLR
jgi:hypothetical protein